jgi:hypothetical protein
MPDAKPGDKRIASAMLSTVTKQGSSKVQNKIAIPTSGTGKTEFERFETAVCQVLAVLRTELLEGERTREAQARREAAQEVTTVIP